MFSAPRIIFDGTEGVGSRFSCFVLPDSFSAVPRVSDPVFMFCAPGLIFGGSVCVGSHPVFMFSAPGHVFGETKGIGSRFDVLRARTRFRRYRGHRATFSSFALPN
jgi:hypothetical protein